MSYDINGIRHVVLMPWGFTCPMIVTWPSVLSSDKPQAFCFITWRTPSLLYYYLTNPSLLYYYLTNPKPSVLLADKPQAFCIITWQIPSLLYYHLPNPKPSVLLPDKPQAFCIITWQNRTGRHDLYSSLRSAWLLITSPVLGAIFWKHNVA